MILFMDPSSIPLLKALSRRMSWLGEREQVLAQNVANVDTPGYTPQDLKKPDFRALVNASSSSALSLARTQPMHLAGTTPATTFKPETQRGGERAPSGNSVSLEAEMMKVSETASDFALTSNLYRRQVAMLKAALGRSTP
jgi:flagellar basal-body rod protein FlgB